MLRNRLTDEGFQLLALEPVTELERIANESTDRSTRLNLDFMDDMTVAQDEEIGKRSVGSVELEQRVDIVGLQVIAHTSHERIGQGQVSGFVPRALQQIRSHHEQFHAIEHLRNVSFTNQRAMLRRDEAGRWIELSNSRYRLAECLATGHVQLVEYLDVAPHDYNRQKRLYEQRAAGQRDYEQAEDTFLKAKAELERSRQKARLLRADGQQRGWRCLTASVSRSTERRLQATGESPLPQKR
jgi:hypothetical protein